jgi:hypothetical protein
MHACMHVCMYLYRHDEQYVCILRVDLHACMYVQDLALMHCRPAEYAKIVTVSVCMHVCMYVCIQT